MLEPDEVIARIVLPADPPDRSVYLKVRERESGDFALVSVAAAITLDADGNVGGSRIALGGVAPVPYRAIEVEDFLAGKSASQVDAAEAAALALPDTTPLPQNAYKLPMARNTVRRALTHLLVNA